jgi:diaminopimelate decarboxylase
LRNPLGGRRLAELADRYGTPFYAYDFDVFDEQARRLRAAVPARFELFYAVKANPSLSVLSAFARRGLGADVASAGEITAALAAGFSPDRLLMSGPAKTDVDLAAAVRAGILAVNAEGPAELDRLQAIAEEAKSRVDVQLRLNPRGRKTERIPILGGRGAGKFGMSMVLARETLARRSRWPRLFLSGFHVFQASNVLDAKAFVENVRRILAIVLDLARRSDVSLRLVDLGGGFGIPYAPGEERLDLGALKRGLSRIASEISREALFARTRFLFEPGRYLTAPAGVYVCRVLDVKRNGGRRSALHALVDGGIHHLLRPALVGRHPVRLISAGRRRTPAGPVTIGGPLCTSLDVLAERELLPTPEPGDLVAFSNAGAYGYSESMPLFLSHPWAAEIGVRGERDALLRRPPTPAEILSRQEVPRILFAGRSGPAASCETASSPRVANR